MLAPTTTTHHQQPSAVTESASPTPSMNTTVMDPRPARSLAEIAGQLPPEPDRVRHVHPRPSKATCSPALQPLALLNTIATQLQHVASTATDEHGEDTAAASKLAHFASSFLSPLPTSRELAQDKNGAHRCHVSMTALDRLTGASGTLLDDDDVLLAVVPYAGSASASSTGVLADAASKILARQFSQRSKPDFIVSVLLETAIRPHLSKWSSTRLTATGRAAAYEDTVTRTPTDLTASPPWVEQGAPMIPLFQWALNESDVSQYPPPQADICSHIA
ncbi:Tti2 family protein [Candidatus Bathyarchaeota archaeon]|nr:Tti2 family protein [Candidatus Bathyarchaeota archaeon]